MQNQPVGTPHRFSAAGRYRSRWPGGLLAINAWAVCAPAVADALPPSGTDTLIAGLPGVLLAGLALIFAARERGRSRQLRLQLEDVAAANQQPNDNASTLYRAAADHSTVGLWELDSDGRTVYLNQAMLQLLGLGTGTIDEPRNLDLEQRLRRLEDNTQPGSPYVAVVHADGAEARRVLVFEHPLPTSAAGAVTLRTVIDPAQLPGELLDASARTVIVPA